MKVKQLKSKKIIVELTEDEVINAFVKLGISFGFYLLNKELGKINYEVKK